jgi:DNA-binding transcriptional ArsR family regulator
MTKKATKQAPEPAVPTGTRTTSTTARRQLTDAREMRALAHPVRVALLELLSRDGPLTATAAGEVLGESPANMSFHLRTLAKYGFVEEAPGGTGRQRPWRRVFVGNSWDLDNDDAAADAAAEGLARHVAQRTDERRRTWDATRASYPKAWREAAFAIDSLTYLTSDELHDISVEIVAILDRYTERVADRDKRPEGSSPVSIVATGHPIAPTPSGN